MFRGCTAWSWRLAKSISSIQSKNGLLLYAHKCVILITECRHIIAWDAAIDPQSTVKKAVPPHAKTALAQPTTKSYPERAWQIVRDGATRLACEAYVRSKHWLLGDRVRFQL